MTIAAGFHFQDGILLCADTELQQGYSKFVGSKLFIPQLGDLPIRMAFAIAGSVPNAQKAIRRMTEAVRGIPADQCSPTRVVDGMEKCLEEIYENIRRQPGYGRESGPDFWLLIALWTKLGLELYATHEDCINKCEASAFVGIGDYFARYVAETAYRPNFSGMEIIPFAVHVLKQTKNNVPGCGGASQVLMIRASDGEPADIEQFDISTLEEFSGAFHRAFQSLCFEVVNPESTAEHLRNEIAEFADWVMEIKRKNAFAEKERARYDERYP